MIQQKLKKFEKSVICWMFVIFLSSILVSLKLYSDRPESFLEPSNFNITLGFFFIVLIVFYHASKYLSIGTKIDKALIAANTKIVNELAGHKEALNEILEKEAFFNDTYFYEAFEAYKSDLNTMKAISSETEIDIENYINEDLLDKVIRTHFLNQVSATMTGFGILGTFIGLSIGLNSFNLSGSADDITKEIEPLMAGIKVAFHTSIYGLIYSICFSFYYRRTLGRFYKAISEFISSFRKYIVPVASDGKEGSFIKYQKRIIDKLDEQLQNNTVYYKNEQVNQSKMLELQSKIIELEGQQNEAMNLMSKHMAEQVSELMKQTLIPEIKLMREAVQVFASESQKDHKKGLEKIVTSFVEQMNASLGDSFNKLRDILNETSEQQKESIEFTKDVLKNVGNTAAGMDSVNKNIEMTVQCMTDYAKKVEDMQSVVNKNLMSLNIQAEETLKQTEKHSELYDKMLETEEATKELLITTIDKINVQAKALNETNSNIEQKLKDEFDIFAQEISNVTNKLIANSIEAVSLLAAKNSDTQQVVSKFTESIQEKISSIAEQFSTQALAFQNTNNKVTETLENQAKLFADKLSLITENISEINSRITDEILSASKELGNSAKNLDESLNKKIKETFITFDRELAEIVDHFSGTIKGMDKNLQKTKFAYDEMSDDIIGKFNKMQELLDQYIEYADKLHHNIENKWNQLRATDTNN